MAFFSNDYFAKPFFKNQFFGKPFFQEPFFNDTTIAHGVEAETTTDETILLQCMRTITGTVDINDITVTVNGVDNPVLVAVPTGANLSISVTTPIASGASVRLWVRANSANNLGIINNGFVNNVV